MSAEKFLRLSELCELMGDNQDNMCMEYSEAKFEAATLARELFPPMAKALVWAFCDGVWGSGPYTVNRQKASCYQVYGMPIKLKDGYCFASGEAAKAACEAHHQARFLEQLA